MAIEIIAHRGAGQGVVQTDTQPENTLPAFQYAWEVGAHAAELDLHLTRDGRLVVIHDETTLRTTGVEWAVADRTLAELRKLDAGSWKGPQFGGIGIPTLEEVVSTIPEGKRLFVELKTGPAIVRPLADALAGCGRHPRQLPLISFDHDTIALAKRRLPEHECYLLIDFADAVTEDLTGLIARVHAAGLDGIDASWPHPPGLGRRLAGEGLKAALWTVNDVAAARQILAGGIESITTDVPGQMLRALGTIDR